MEIQELKAHIDSRLDRLEGKMDTQLERVSRAETEIGWIKGSMRVGLTLAITVIGGLVSWFVRFR